MAINNINNVPQDRKQVSIGFGMGQSLSHRGHRQESPQNMRLEMRRKLKRNVGLCIKHAVGSSSSSTLITYDKRTCNIEI